MPAAPCSRNRAAVAHRVRARMARCSTRGPCAAVSRGRQAAQRGIGMARAWMPELRQRRSGCPMPMPFRQHMDVLSKSPAPAHGLAGQESGKRQAGWPFSLVTFSLLRASCPPPFGPASPFACAPAHAWPRKEKVTRLPKADESSCSQMPSRQAKASRASALLQWHSASVGTNEVRCLSSPAWRGEGKSRGHEKGPAASCRAFDPRRANQPFLAFVSN